MLFNIGDIVRGDFPTVKGTKHTLAKIADTMDSDQGQMVLVKGEGILSTWVAASECVLLRGVPLEGSLKPSELAILDKLVDLYIVDDYVEELKSIAYVHEGQGILSVTERDELIDIFNKYKLEQRKRYIKLTKRLLEINKEDV